MKHALFVLLLSCVGCSGIVKYDGVVTRAEYSHNFYQPKVGETLEFSAAHAGAGVVFNLLGQDGLELTLSVAGEARGAEQEIDPGILLNPRVMWFFAPSSFLQFELDHSITKNQGENTFGFIQLEKRW